MAEEEVAQIPSPAAPPSPEELIHGTGKHDKLLGPWSATAICGNDITSSCLYVSGIAIVYAQALAPLSLLLAAGVLYLYRKIYTEVVEALPLDGGAYNCLLNCTRKFDASFAACLTLLSYLATAVISAKTAAEYIKDLLPYLPPMETTAVILVVFAGLTIMGISDSARVALAIFLLHLATLTLFIVFVILALPAISLWDSWCLNFQNFGQGEHWLKSLFFGFSAAMLGVSGFESSANYVEAQKPGVFRLTLRNMWMAVTIFNPLLALLALGLLPVPEIVAVKDDLIAKLGFQVGGRTLQTIIMVDAFLVLSGAVLTSYVGVSGLVHRMTLDQCFPQVLLKSTKRGSYPLIIVGFMVLCLSILYLTRGELLSLAGVYTISFLGVMSLFGIGNILLKVNRRELKRTYRAGWTVVIIGVLATLGGIIGNLILDIRFLYYFGVYFVPAVIGGILMYLRIPILRGILIIIDEILTRISYWRRGVEEKIAQITNVRMVVFVRLGRLPRLIKAFNYIDRNEASENILIIRYYTEDNSEIEANLQKNLEVIRELYPNIKIRYRTLYGTFGPYAVSALSQELKVPPNFMFIGSVTEKQSFSLQDLGGVRVIF
jgi:amino acid transporter